MFYGDGMITPAISVLGAVEGLEIIAPQLHPFIVPVTLVIILALFAIQKRGTASVGHPLRPGDVHVVRRAGGARASEIARNPTCCARSIRYHAISFVAATPRIAFLTLGAVVLAVTGTEALYADMGHFGAAPIRRAWLLFVMPALVAQLFRAGRAAARRPDGDQEPVLPAGAAVGAHPARDPRDLRRGDRLASRHLRRLFADARGDPDGLLPAAQAAAHLRAPDRPDLCAIHQLDAAGRGGPARAGVPELRQPGRRLRHRGDARDDDRLRADLRRDAADLGLEAARLRSRSRCRLPRSTSRF